MPQRQDLRSRALRLARALESVRSAYSNVLLAAEIVEEILDEIEKRPVRPTVRGQMRIMLSGQVWSLPKTLGIILKILKDAQSWISENKAPQGWVTQDRLLEEIQMQLKAPKKMTRRALHQAVYRLRRALTTDKFPKPRIQSSTTNGYRLLPMEPVDRG